MNVERVDRADRASTLRTGMLLTAEGERQVRLRNISAGGAGIFGNLSLALREDVMLQVGPDVFCAKVAWIKGDNIGLKFQASNGMSRLDSRPVATGRTAATAGWLKERPDPYAKPIKETRRDALTLPRRALFR